MKMAGGDFGTGSDDENKENEALNTSTSSTSTLNNDLLNIMFGESLNNQEKQPARVTWEDQLDDDFQVLQNRSSFFDHDFPQTEENFTQSTPRRESIYFRRNKGEAATLEQSPQPLDYSCGSLEGIGGSGSETSFRRELMETAAHVEALQHQVHKLTDENEQLKTQFNQTEESYNQILLERDELRKSMLNLKGDLRKAKEAERRANETTLFLQEREDTGVQVRRIISNHKKELAAKEQELEELSSKLHAVEEELNEVKQKETKCQADLKSSANELKQLLNEYLLVEKDLGKKSDMLAQLQLMYNELLESNETLRAEKLSLEEQLREAQLSSKRFIQSPPSSVSEDIKKTPIDKFPRHSTPHVKVLKAIPGSLCKEIANQLTPDSTFPNPICGLDNDSDFCIEEEVNSPIKPPEEHPRTCLENKFSKCEETQTEPDLPREFEDEFCKKFDTTSNPDINAVLEFARSFFASYSLEQKPKTTSELSPVPLPKSPIPITRYPYNNNHLPVIRGNLQDNRANCAHNEAAAADHAIPPKDSKVDATDVLSLNSEYFSCSNISCQILPPMDHLNPTFRSRSGSFLSAIDHSITDGAPSEGAETMLSPSTSVSGKLSVLPEEDLVTTRRRSLEHQATVHRPHTSQTGFLVAPHADRSHHHPGRLQAPEITVQVEAPSDTSSPPPVVTTPTDNSLLMAPDSLAPDSVKPFPSLSDDLLRKMGLHKDKPLSSEELSEQDIEEVKPDKSDHHPPTEEPLLPTSTSPLPVSLVAPPRRQAVAKHELMNGGTSTSLAHSTWSFWRTVLGVAVAVMVLSMILMSPQPLRSVPLV